MGQPRHHPVPHGRLAGRPGPEPRRRAVFGGDNWDSAFAGGPVGDGSFSIVDELTTTMASVQFGERAVQYLTHEPFSYFIRLENPTANDADVTVRIYLAPVRGSRSPRVDRDGQVPPHHAGHDEGGDLPARHRLVGGEARDRPQPVAALSGDTNADGGSYCDCGWPYTLLLPRGTSDGMAFRLLVLVSDATVDLVPAPDQCGSMSYCGAVDRYPDAASWAIPSPARSRPRTRAFATRSSPCPTPRAAP